MSEPTLPKRPVGLALIQVLDKALKIRELARRGVGGERIAARDRLEALLTKNDIPEQSLDRYVLLKQGKLRRPQPAFRPGFQGVRIVVVGSWGSPWGAQNTSTASETSTTNIHFF